MAHLKNKSPKLVTPRVANNFDQLSKAALIDLCADLLYRAEGENISDDELLAKLTSDYLPPVLNVRGDRMPKFK